MKGSGEKGQTVFGVKKRKRDLHTNSYLIPRRKPFFTLTVEISKAISY